MKPLILRLYARLLRLYPRDFYTRFADEMHGVFTQAWDDRPPGRTAVLVFILHEFGGLLISIASERSRAGGKSVPRFLFRKGVVPLWIFICCLAVAVIFSLSYWGYLVVPSSTFSTIATIDHIALVRFDADYTPVAIPLNDLPYVVTPDFPPSQILTTIYQRQANLAIDKTLDPTLSDQLAAALAKTGIDLASRRNDYATEPVINPNGCGENCFHPGVQPQPDGSLLILYPEMILEGQPPIEASSQWVTPNHWWYYTFILPAGYVVQGRSTGGSSLIFMALATGAVANDRHQYHELTFTRGADGLRLQNHMHYNFDVSGLEGMNVPVVTLFLFLPLLFLWFLILFLAALVNTIRRLRRRMLSASAL